MSKQETHEVRQLSEIPGIMSCLMTHKAISTTCDFRWNGPKLNAVWPGVLAFFKWTYDTTHSESQVRLFVNKNTKEWRAWAFPQKAKLGMSAHELTQGDEGYERAAEQRAMFSDADGWEYWGTVHHHCAASAFQSGTDQQNERSQEGLHITVGNLNTAQYDIHYRVYKSGYKLTSVKLSEFWDIGPVLESVPEVMRPFLNPEWVELITKKQMGIPAPDAEFPQIWKDNVVDVTPKAVVVAGGAGVQQSWQTHGYSGQNYHLARKPFTERASPNLDWDLKRAVAELNELLEHPRCLIGRLDMALDLLEKLHNDLTDEAFDVFDICSRNDVTPANLYEYIVRETMKKLNQEKAEEEAAKNGNGKKGKKQQQQEHWADRNFQGYEGMMGD